MTDLRNVPPPDPSMYPKDDPRDFTVEPRKPTNKLEEKAQQARLTPDEWVFYDYIENLIPWDHNSWVNSVRRGEKAALGKLTEQWNAKVDIVTLTDGVKLGAKYIVFLGPRSNGSEPN